MGNSQNRNRNRSMTAASRETEESSSNTFVGRLHSKIYSISPF